MVRTFEGNSCGSPKNRPLPGGQRQHSSRSCHQIRRHTADSEIAGACESEVMTNVPRCLMLCAGEIGSSGKKRWDHGIHRWSGSHGWPRCRGSEVSPPTNDGWPRCRGSEVSSPTNDGWHRSLALGTGDIDTMQAQTSIRVPDTSMTPPPACLLSAASAHTSISTGKERDTESGNDYFGARYYAARWGGG